MPSASRGHNYNSEQQTMQAPLSSTASGKYFHTEPLTALSPATPLSVASQLASLPVGLRAGSGNAITGLQCTELQPTTQHDGIANGLGLAHDAGNLMGALSLYCELLATPGVLRDEHRHYAAELQLLSGRSRELIDRLLCPTTTSRRLAAVPATQKTDTAERIVVPDVIEGCRGLLNAVARRAVAVAYGAGAALPVAVSRQALERILVNLTKNAAEAAPDGRGAITLRVTSRQERGAPGWVVLTVEDKGRGMSSAAVKVLLGERAASEQRTGSRGIGFQVVKELVVATGGKLQLKSRCGAAADSGTTVEIAWAVSAAAGAREEQPPLSDSPPPLKKRRLMLMTDSRNAAGRTSC